MGTVTSQCSENPGLPRPLPLPPLMTLFHLGRLPPPEQPRIPPPTPGE